MTRLAGWGWVILAELLSATPSFAQAAGTITTLYGADADVVVYVGGVQATVLFKGLAPGYPAQCDPAAVPESIGPLPLAIQTVNAFHDQVDIWVR